MMTQVSMAANTTPHRLPPLVYSKSVSPSRDPVPPHETGGKAVQDTRGALEGLGTAKNQQEKAARKRELARRHLSNSLQGMKTILPDLRRTQSFNVPVPNGVKDPGKPHAAGLVRRDTASLGSRKPSRDLQNPTAAGLRRSHSLRESPAGGGGGRDGSSSKSSMDSPLQLPLSQSLPQPANISLTALMHELNASMHHRHRHASHGHSSSPHNNDDSDDEQDTIDRLFDYENGLDPDLFPRLTGGQDVSSEMPDGTLTPALRKLNRRRVSSRVRTQQWINQIQRDQRQRQSQSQSERRSERERQAGDQTGGGTVVEEEEEEEKEKNKKRVVGPGPGLGPARVVALLYEDDT